MHRDVTCLRRTRLYLMSVKRLPSRQFILRLNLLSNFGKNIGKSFRDSEIVELCHESFGIEW
jgi:hypothetical protein